MDHCRSEAIVLGVTDYREADRLVTLFTRDLGKIRGIARGAKRSVRRFAGALELFARLQVQMTHGDGLARLQGADIDTVFLHIRRDLLKIALAAYACDLVDSLTGEGMPAPRLFRLLSAYLERLDGEPAALSDRRFFELNLLNILGYRPPLDECGACRLPFVQEERLFTAEDGTIRCGRCSRTGRLLSPETLRLLKQALAVGRFGAITFSAEGLAEAGALLDPLLAAHLHRPLKSLPFLREMGG